MCGHEVGSEPGLDGSFGQGHAEMRLAHPPADRALPHCDGFVSEAQRAKFADLAFIDGGLKAEVRPATAD